MWENMLCVTARSVLLKRQHAIILNVGFKKLHGFFLKKRAEYLYLL